MRLLLVLLSLAILFAVGCNTEGDKYYNSYNYYYPEDSTNHPDTTDAPVRITYPERYERIEIWYDWINFNYPDYNGCRWGYDIDTTIRAEVVTDISEDISSAQVYLRTNDYSGFSAYGPAVIPTSSTFSVIIYNINQSGTYSPPDTLNYSFWVQVTTESGSNYISPTVPFQLISKVDFPLVAIPDVPEADTVFESSYYQQMTITWCPQSPNVDSFKVHLRTVGTGETVHFAVTGTQRNYSIRYYLPVTAYTVWVTAENEYGESDASESLSITTNPPFLPEDLRAIQYPDHRIELQWYNIAYPDTIQVSRRDTLGEWTTIRALDCTNYRPSSYVDSTAQAHSIYYYRLGIQFANGTWWTPDSIGVWIP
ncbi:MAG: fibronectin type III domain-containing protein [Calditrichota bacterium]